MERASSSGECHDHFDIAALLDDGVIDKPHLYKIEPHLGVYYGTYRRKYILFCYGTHFYPLLFFDSV